MVDLVYRQIPYGPGGEPLWKWEVEFAKGLMLGHRQEDVLAVTEAQSSTDGIQVIGDENGDIAYPTTEDYLQIVSTSADDSESNTGPNKGARRVRVTGINEANLQVSEVVQLNGTTPVQTQNKFLRVNLMRCTLVAVDNDLAPAGTITAVHPSGTLNKMRPNYNRENFATFYTRALHKYLFWNLQLSAGFDDEFQVQVQQKQPLGSGWRTEAIFMVYESAVKLSPVNWVGLVLPGRDLRIIAEKTNLGIGTISAQIELMRIETQTGI